MIIDQLKNLKLYTTLHPAIEKIAEYMAQNDLVGCEVGKLLLEGDDLFCNIAQTKTQTRAEAKLEAHRRYIDLQIPLEGVETMGYTPLELCSSIFTPYNEEKDVAFFRGRAQSYFQVETGMFALFFPQDAHAPGITPTGGKKAIFKIKMI